MNDSLIQTLGWAAITIMGMYFVVHHKRLGFLVKKFQRETFKIHTNEKWNSVWYLVGGLIFVIFGVIGMLKLFKF